MNRKRHRSSSGKWTDRGSGSSGIRSGIRSCRHIMRQIFITAEISGKMHLHKVPLLWIRYEVWLQELNGKCSCLEVKAPQTQMSILLKCPIVGPCTYGCHFSYGAALQGQAFEFWKASNNNFSKRYHAVHTKSDLSVRKPCIAGLHPASIGGSPVC